MPTPTTAVAAVKAAVRAQLLAVAGIGQVYARRGGVRTWLKDPRPARNHWEVHVRRVRPQSADIGPSRFEFYEVLIEGWMPFSFENPDTTAPWDALLEAIGARLEANMSLGGTVNDAEPLELQLNDFQTLSAQGSGHEIAENGEVTCHFCRWILTVRGWHAFTTT